MRIPLRSCTFAVALTQLAHKTGHKTSTSQDRPADRVPCRAKSTQSTGTRMQRVIR